MIVHNQAESTAWQDDLQACGELGLKMVKVYPTEGPKCGCHKGTDCPSPGKHPIGSSWQTRATSAAVTLILHAQQGGNVGLLLGPQSGVVDVEFDNEEGQAVADKLLADVRTVAYRSSRSIHRLFRYAEWMEEICTDGQGKAKVDVAGLEVRTGCGGKAAQSVMPPSVHSSGVRYSWLLGCGPADVPIAEMPRELVEFIREHASKAKKAGGAHSTNGKHSTRKKAPPSAVDRCLAYVMKIDVAKQGQQGSNPTFHAAAECAKFGLDEQQAWQVMAWYNANRCEPPWSDAELQHKMDDAYRDVLAKGEFGCRLEEDVRSTDRQSVGGPAGSVAPDAWPEIIPFDSVTLPEFPTAALPDDLREWVEAESRATQTPPDLAGMLSLGVCAAAIAKRIEIEPREGWREPTNLFGAVLLEPGNRKSAVFNDTTKPLREIEAELIESSRPRIAREQSERRQAEARLKELEKIASKKGDDDSRQQAYDLAEHLAMLPEAAPPRLIVDDATNEKLTVMLSEQGGRIASMSPEGGVFDLMAGLYAKNGMPTFGVYLMGHSGDDLVTDRITRRPVRVERPALTCLYAMQPAVIAGLAENSAFRGRGLLARFLYSAPRSWIGSREIAPQPVPREIREQYHAIVRGLAHAQGPITLRLDASAAPTFIAWETEIEEMLADGGTMEGFRDWGSKLAGATLRIAAVLHCVSSFQDLQGTVYGSAVPGLDGFQSLQDIQGAFLIVENSILERAIEIARYLIPHAEQVLRLMEIKEKDSIHTDALYLLTYLKKHDLKHFSKTDAQQDCKRRFPRADDIDPVLNELAARGYIRMAAHSTASRPGRPSSPTYDVNPAAFAFQMSGKRPANPKNSPGWCAKQAAQGRSGPGGGAGSLFFCPWCRSAALEETSSGLRCQSCNRSAWVFDAAGEFVRADYSEERTE